MEKYQLTYESLVVYGLHDTQKGIAKSKKFNLTSILMTDKQYYSDKNKSEIRYACQGKRDNHGYIIEKVNMAKNGNQFLVEDYSNNNLIMFFYRGKRGEKFNYMGLYRIIDQEKIPSTKKQVTHFVFILKASRSKLNKKILAYLARIKSFEKEMLDF
jgi:hypothetical protein